MGRAVTQQHGVPPLLEGAANSQEQEPSSVWCLTHLTVPSNKRRVDTMVEGHSSWHTVSAVWLAWVYSPAQSEHCWWMSSRPQIAHTVGSNCLVGPWYVNGGNPVRYHHVFIKIVENDEPLGEVEGTSPGMIMPRPGEHLFGNNYTLQLAEGETRRNSAAAQIAVRHTAAAMHPTFLGTSTPLVEICHRSVGTTVALAEIWGASWSDCTACLNSLYPIGPYCHSCWSLLCWAGSPIREETGEGGDYACSSVAHPGAPTSAISSNTSV